MVEEVIEGRQPLGPLLALFHPEKQALTQFPQLGQLLLQHLMDVGKGEGREDDMSAVEPALHPSLWPRTPALLPFPSGPPCPGRSLTTVVAPKPSSSSQVDAAWSLPEMSSRCSLVDTS